MIVSGFLNGIIPTISNVDENPVNPWYEEVTPKSVFAGRLLALSYLSDRNKRCNPPLWYDFRHSDARFDLHCIPIQFRKPGRCGLSFEN